MNYITRELMGKYGIDSKTAEAVQSEMEMIGIDFSECTQTEFDACADEAYSSVKEQEKA